MVDPLVIHSNSFYPSNGHARWLKVRKISTHFFSAAFLCPRFDRSVVGVDQYQVELFFCALHNIRIHLIRLFFISRSGKYLLAYRKREIELTML
jgi:hypothetical protein